MKRPLTALLLLASAAFAQNPPAPATAAVATPSPVPTATPAPSATPSATPVPTPTPTLSEIVNALSDADVDEVLKTLKANYVDPSALTDAQVNRAALQGLATRLAPGVLLLASGSSAQEEASPFRAEILDGRIGYMRPGAMNKDALGELDAALKNFTDKSIGSLILDLRATPPSSDFDAAADVARRFVPKGQMLFTVRKPGVKQERMSTSNQDPAFTGLIIVVVDADTSGAGEVVAAVLRAQTNCMIVGENTQGHAVEFSSLPLRNDRMLRVAVSEVVLAGGAAIFPNGVRPDVPVVMSTAVKREILKQSLVSGVSQFVFEAERPRMNEAALVAGTNPDVDALQAEQKKRAGAKAQLQDTMLQRAVDLITTISILKKPGAN
jgi:hypothetical protein